MIGEHTGIIGILLPVCFVLLAVGVHYEALHIATNALRRLRLNHRIHVALTVLIALGAHFTEAVLFAIAWLIVDRSSGGALSITDPTFVDLLYFSLSTYTSLGYGDIFPTGPARVLAGIEALTGLVLIAWTASFTYLEMREHWNGRKPSAGGG